VSSYDAGGSSIYIPFRWQADCHGAGMNQDLRYVAPIPSGALNTTAEYKAMHMIGKGQIHWLAKRDAAGQIAFLHSVFGIGA
jgi:hypothetical protein